MIYFGHLVLGQTDIVSLSSLTAFLVSFWWLDTPDLHVWIFASLRGIPLALALFALVFCNDNDFKYCVICRTMSFGPHTSLAGAANAQQALV